MKHPISAPGKAILFGEHAVVYGRPAIAVPLTQIRAYANVKNTDKPLTVIAKDIDRPPLHWRDIDLASTDPIQRMTANVCGLLRASKIKGEICLRSTIPIARGLGSGAAVSAVLARALAVLVGCELSQDDANSLVYEVEKLHHGTPSGIDNSVVVYEKPVYFVKDRRIEFVHIHHPMHLVLADTGIPALTRETVADVRDLFNQQRPQTAAVFDAIGSIAEGARDLIENGNQARLGELMTENHKLLQALNVSSTALDGLVAAALKAGAYGAKLSGGGRGGFIIALVEEGASPSVRGGLLAAGAKQVYATALGGEMA